MELTKEQVRQVEAYLQKKNFNFIDLKEEVLDHIVSDIENFTAKGLSFENAFKMIVLKWEQHFKETSSFYFGIQYYQSKIVLEKAVKMFRPFFFVYLSAYSLPVLFLNTFSIVFSEKSIDFLNLLFNAIAFLSLIYFIFIIIRGVTSKVKTTYRFILKTQYLAVIFLIIPLLSGNHFNDKGNLNAIFTGFLLAGFSVTYTCHYFLRKHNETVRSYKNL
tara:strand:- start:476 stop:1129 length:654 start_codon:yes stop_codon:yes gene_type:complete